VGASIVNIWLLSVLAWLAFWLIVWMVVWSICCLLGLVLYRYAVPWLRRRGSLIRQWSPHDSERGPAVAELPHGCTYGAVDDVDDGHKFWWRCILNVQDGQVLPGWAGLDPAVNFQPVGVVKLRLTVRLDQLGLRNLTFESSFFLDRTSAQPAAAVCRS